MNGGSGSSSGISGMMMGGSGGVGVGSGTGTTTGGSGAGAGGGAGVKLRSADRRMSTKPAARPHGRAPWGLPCPVGSYGLAYSG